MTSVLPVRQKYDPVKAWKVARIVKHSGRLTFRGCVFPLMYPATPSTAICGCRISPAPNSEPHKQISVGTSCGFYGMKEDRLDVNARMMGWGHCGQLYLLEVEFWGTVIVGEHGYRASRQRVLSCRPYGAPFQETSGFVPGSLLHDEQGMFLPYRQDFKVNRVHRVSLADATASLGTEVIYDESVLAVGWQRRVDQKIQAEKLARHLETLQRAKEDFTKFTKPRNPAEGQGRFYSQDWTGRLDD